MKAPRYHCETCRDSGLVFKRDTGDGENFKRCPDCDGKSRLCGEVDDNAELADTLSGETL